MAASRAAGNRKSLAFIKDPGRLRECAARQASGPIQEV